MREDTPQMDTRMLLRDRLRRSRDWVTAIDELEKELEQSGAKPEQSERLYELARLTEEVVPERETALRLYQRAWKLHPDNPKALSRAREVYEEIVHLSAGLYTRITGFQTNLLDGKPNDWRCRAGAR